MPGGRGPGGMGPGGMGGPGGMRGPGGMGPGGMGPGGMRGPGGMGGFGMGGFGGPGMPPPRRGFWGWRRGGCLGCLMYVLGAGALIAALIAGLAMLIF